MARHAFAIHPLCPPTLRCRRPALSLIPPCLSTLLPPSLPPSLSYTLRVHALTRRECTAGSTNERAESGRQDTTPLCGKHSLHEYSMYSGSYVDNVCAFMHERTCGMQSQHAPWLFLYVNGISMHTCMCLWMRMFLYMYTHTHCTIHNMYTHKRVNIDRETATLTPHT